MKKFTGKIFAGIFTAAVLATAAFATDYVKNPDYTTPEKVETVESVEAGKTVTVDGEAAKVKGSALSALKEDESVTFQFKNATIKVSGVDPTKVTEDVTLGVNVVTEAEDTTVDGVAVPKGAVVVTPAQQGEFGMTLTVTVDTTLTDKAKLYYVSTDGKEVKDVTTESKLKIKDGKATFEITHASQYVLSETEIKAAADGKDDDTPDTGVTLPIALVVLAGGSVAVSAIAAKKRK